MCDQAADHYFVMEEEDIGQLEDLCSFMLNYTASDNSSDISASGLFLLNASLCSGIPIKQDAVRHTLNDVFIHLTPIIIVVGVVGNLLSFLVFCFTHLQRLSSSFYLSSLSLADVGFLVCLFFVWLDRIDVRLFTKEGWCQTIIYIMRVCEFLSVWSVVSFTAERYIIVYHPLQKDSFCTRRKAKIVSLCLFFYSLAFYVYPFWTYDVIHIGNTKSVCSPLPVMHDTTTALSSIHTLQACALPSAVIVVLNVRLMIKLHLFQKRYSGRQPRGQVDLPPNKRPQKSYIHTSLSTTGSMHIKFSSRPRAAGTRGSHAEELGSLWTGLRDPEGNVTQPSTRTLQSRSQYRTARMLLIISSVFVLLNLPNHGFRVQGFLRSLLGLSAKQTRSQYIWQEVFQLVYFLNFAINFFVYSACARQFRTGLRRLCHRCSYRLDKAGRVFRECQKLGERTQIKLDTLKPERYV